MDRTKIEIVEKLPPHTSLKGVIGFLGHTSFYWHFIEDFSLIAKPLTNLFIKDVPFVFDDVFLSALNMLKKALISAPIITPPDSSLPFKIICDASDYAIGAVLGQRKEN